MLCLDDFFENLPKTRSILFYLEEEREMRRCRVRKVFDFPSPEEERDMEEMARLVAGVKREEWYIGNLGDIKMIINYLLVIKFRNTGNW